MKNKIKKIMATALLSMTATSAIGCATTNTKIAQKINNGIEDFVSSINKLDYVETNNSDSKIGKIVSAVNEDNLYTKMTASTSIENTITRPSERSDNFKLYVLSTSPYITLTSDDNNLNFSMQVSTEKIETTSDDIDNKINQLILKRAILMIYVNEIYNGNVSLTDENRKSINAYVNIIKENASFLNGNRGMVKNQLGMASNLIEKQSNDDIVNYYIIKSGEALEIRSNKIESSISAIDSIISILEQNLTPSSCYYQNNLSSSYQNMVSKLETNQASSENEILAKNIAESIDMLDSTKTQESSQITQQATSKTRTNSNNYQNTRKTTVQNNQSQTKINNRDCIDCDKTTTQNNNNLNNNNTNNQNNNLQTLELREETNNLNTNTTTRNTTNKTQNSSNYSRNSLNNEDFNNNSTNTTNNNYNRTISRNRRNRLNRTNQTPANPTMNIDTLTPNNNTNNSQNNLSRNETISQRQSSANNNDINRATRVPYRVSTNVTPD